ncbi:MAG: autotransporter assembly complex family protein [Pseudomonadota bacterium]
MRAFFIAVILTVLSATQLKAFELRFVSASSSETLNQSLRAASLLVPLADKAAADPQDVLAAAQAEYARLIGALYEEGHFAPVIKIRVDGREAASISPLATLQRIRRVQVQIDPGPTFSFGETQLGPLAQGTELPEAFARGQTARTGAIRAAVETGIEGWRDVGHAKATISKQDLRANHPARRLDTRVTLAPGPQLRFGNLNIRGNKAVRTERIRDIAGLPSGAVFDPDELRKASQRLRRTGAFSVAALSEAEQIGPSNTLDIDAQIVEQKPRRFGFGLEYSTSEGIGLQAFWLHRNLVGGAERLRVSGEIDGIGGQSGGVDYSFGARFTRPATFNEDTDFYAETQLESLNEENFSADRFSIEAGIIRYASDERTYTFGLGLRRAKTQDDLGARDYTLVYGTASAEFDYRNDPLNATDGYYALVSLTPFGALQGTQSGLRSYADLRAYKSAGAQDRLTFALRGQLGSVYGPSLTQAPADYLFYSGGGGTVRGHRFQALGVDLGGGNTIGGRSFLGLSAELRVKARDKLSVVGFTDAGYISSEAFPNLNDGRWHSGAGLGIRYDTGIGPLRVDVAVPVTGPGNPSGFELYIGIGQAF